MDDDNFSNQKSSLTVPWPVSLLRYVSTVNSVNRLLCLYGPHQDARDEEMVVLWNPSIGKAVGIPISNSLFQLTGNTFIGFGVCPNASDPKLVRINTIIGYGTTVDWEVEVYTLSARVWKSVLNIIPPAIKSSYLKNGQVFVGGFIYFCAYDDIRLQGGIRSNLIVSFDLKSDEFGEVCLPDRLVHKYDLRVTKIKDSLGEV